MKIKHKISYNKNKFYIAHILHGFLMHMKISCYQTYGLLFQNIWVLFGKKKLCYKVKYGKKTQSEFKFVWCIHMLLMVLSLSYFINGCIWYIGHTIQGI